MSTMTEQQNLFGETIPTTKSVATNLVLFGGCAHNQTDCMFCGPKTAPKRHYCPGCNGPTTRKNQTCQACKNNGVTAQTTGL
jgi:predicted amidophosphoribosyltransferase